MKFIIAILFLLIITVTHSELYFNILKDNCNTTTCTPDCTGLRICLGTSTIDVDCGVQTNNSKQFCNSLTLSCDASSDYCQINGETECPLGAGTFPDLRNCHRYFTCDAKLYRVNYDCGDKVVYDPVQETCSTSTQCYDFGSTGLCKGSVPRMIAHPLKKSFYVICTTGLTVLQKCKYDNYIFDPTIAKCAFSCTKAGRYPDMEDPLKIWYFECIPNGTTFIQRRSKCQANTIFDPATQACKPK